MKSKSISLIIGLMTLALLGVMGMQLYFLKQSYQLKSQLFDQNVNEALGNVVAKLEKLDANSFLRRKAESPKKRIDHKKNPVYYSAIQNKKPVRKKRLPIETFASILKSEQRQADSIFSLRDSLLRIRYPNALSFNDALTAADFNNLEYKLQVDVIEFQDALGQIHHKTQQTLTKAFGNGTAPAINANYPFRIDSVKQYVVFDPQYGPRLITIPKPKLVTISRKVPTPQKEENSENVKNVKAYFDEKGENKDVFKDLYTEYQQVSVPLNQRIHPLILDSMLRTELMNQAIPINFKYKVTSARRDSLIFTNASNQTKFLPFNSYQSPLFPKDMIRDAGLLTITFPDKTNIILSNLTAMMGLSGGLLLILLFCFGYTLHSILKQKKLSEMKTDFINNMTHEFKTPVATIMIASEALKDPELTEDKTRLEKLANIIYDENVRLGNHIERVLNIAKIDKGDLKLEYKEVDMNDLLSAIVDSMALQLEKRNASINLKLDALKATVLGDELHLSNVIFNLIDNANKYSKADPEIKITTLNSCKNLIIRVADNGIGMNRDQQAKIFEQFYRIPTGNLHDVKGFGLGLSYVNDIIRRSGGTIRVKSEKDKGSEFEIVLPALLRI